MCVPNREHLGYTYLRIWTWAVACTPGHAHPTPRSGVVLVNLETAV